MNEMLSKRLSNLLTVKSIVTVILTIVFSIMAIKGELPTELMTIYTTVIGFYFGTQAVKEGKA